MANDVNMTSNRNSCWMDDVYISSDFVDDDDDNIKPEQQQQQQLDEIQSSSDIVVVVDVDVDHDEPKCQVTSEVDDDDDDDDDDDNKIECEICDVWDCRPERNRCDDCGKKLCLYYELRGRMNFNNRQDMPVSVSAVRETYVDEMRCGEYCCLECSRIDFTGREIPLEYLIDLELKDSSSPDRSYDKNCVKCYGRLSIYREVTKLIVNTGRYVPQYLYHGCYEEEEEEELKVLKKEIVDRILKDDNNNYVCCVCRNYGYYGPIEFVKPRKGVEKDLLGNL